MVDIREVARDSDGKTIDRAHEDAEQAHLAGRARRSILVDASGTIIDGSNPLPVDIDSVTFEGDLEVHLRNSEDDVLVYGQDNGGTNRPIMTSTDGRLSALRTGQQPDGDFVNEKADGEAFSDTSNLTANEPEIYPLDESFIDTDGWRSIQLVVVSDQPSAPDGIEIQFTKDSDVGTVDCTITREFTADDVANGFAVFNFPPILDGYRVKYTNGSTGTSSFLIASTLRVNSIEQPTSPIESVLSGTTLAQTGRSVIAGKDPSGDYVNFEATTSGNFKVSLEEFETQVSSDSNTKLNTVLFGNTLEDGTGTFHNVVVDSAGQLKVASTEATQNETFGTATAISVGSTGSVVSITANSGDNFRGFQVTGDREALAFVEINGTKKFSKRLGPGNSFNAEFFLPGPRALSNTDTVELKVTNEDQVDEGSGDYEGLVLIE